LTLLQTVTSNIDMEIARLKRDLDKSLRQELKLKAIPKPSERRKEKARIARMRWKKKIEKMSGSGNGQGPSWRFIYRDGECRKVIMPAKRIRQI